MKNSLKQLSLFILALTMTLVSCREEESIFIDGPELETLKADSNIARLLQNTAAKDGSDDNIIDNASCISIELPVSVIVNDLEIVVDSPEDFSTIEAVFDEFDDDDDVLEIAFPITIVLSDFTELVVNNLDELEDFADDCNGENEFDDDIECADIKYPVTASVFNSNNEIIDTIALNNDKDLYEFVDDLDENDVVRVNFPVVVSLFDGTEVRASNFDELEDILDNAKDNCDEDDDNDFNDDDCDNCTTNQLSDVLVGCAAWIVDKLERNDEDLEDLYSGYRFQFEDDGTLSAESGSESFSGTWETNGSGNDISVIINIPNLSDFNATWKLHEIEQDGGESDVDLRIGDDNRLRFESNCNGAGDDDNADDDNVDDDGADDDGADDNDGDDNNGDDNDGSDLSSVLVDGLWSVSSYIDDGNDQTNDYSGFTFNFGTNGSVIADNGSTINGAWASQPGDNKLVLDFGEAVPLDEFNDDWDVISVSDTRVELRDVSGSDGSVDSLILVKQ